MLSFLREKASGWFAKVMFGGIALIFALYFGFSSGGGPPAGGTAPIAKVNGEGIPVGLLSQTVENQLNIYQQFNTNQGQEFRKILETQILQGMIRATLFAQEAERLGLRITDQALADAIRSNPSFAQDGQFNEDFYLNQFKPYFERTNGENYEYALRQEMLAKRLQQALSQGAVVANDQLKNQQKLKTTQVTFEKLIVPIQAGESARTREEAIKIAQQWIEAKQSNLPDTEILKAQELKVENITDQSLEKLLDTFAKDFSLAPLACLAKVAPGEVCAQPFPSPEAILALRLVSREVTENTDSTLQETLRNQLTQTKQNLILEGVGNTLVKQAKIETFLTQ